MEQTNIKRYIIWGQICFWVILFILDVIEQLEYGDFSTALLTSISGFAYIVPIIYIHYYWLLPVYVQGKKWIHLTATFLLIILFMGIYTLITESIAPSGQDYDATTLAIGTFYYFLLTVVGIVIFSMIYFVEEWHENFTKTALLKSEKLQAELSFLKSQINPHFLFNTLNNIYSYTQIGDEKAAPMLERLSLILRYMVYDCEAERVFLKKELAAINHLLEIHKMKNSKQQNIQFSSEGVTGYHLIAPLVLVNFVENACKHSDTISNPNGFIKIDVLVDEANNCQFTIKNTFKQKNSITSKYEGVGLTNIKKRLVLQYGETYAFSERKEGQVYHLNLKIPLEREQ